VDIRIVAPSVRIFRPQVMSYVRQNRREMLRKGGRDPSQGYYLGLVRGWRLSNASSESSIGCGAFATEAFPKSRPLSALRRTVGRWVAPTDQKSPPGLYGPAVDSG